MIIVKGIEIIILAIMTMAIVFDSNIKRILFYLLVVMHMSVPLFLLRGAQDSGIFALDIFLLVVLYKMYGLSGKRLFKSNDTVGLSIILIGLYIAFIGVPNTYLVGLQEQFVAAGFWVIRFFMYYLLYRIGRNMAWTGMDHKSFAQINILAVLPVLLIAAVHYSGLMDLNYSLEHAPNLVKGIDIERVHQGILGHTRASMGVLFMIVFFLTLILYGPKVPMAWRLVAVIVSLTVIVECLFSFSRSTVYGLLLGSVILIVLTRKFKFLLLLLLCLTVAGTIVHNRPDLNKRFLMSENTSFRNVNKFSAGRLGGWQAAYNGFRESPFTAPFGMGFRSFRAAMQQQKVMMYAGHNVFLQTVVELGLVGLSMFFMFQFLVVQKIWQGIKTARYLNDRECHWGAQVSLVLFLTIIISSFSQDNLYPNWAMHPCNMYLYFVLGVLVNIRPNAEMNLNIVTCTT